MKKNNRKNNRNKILLFIGFVIVSFVLLLEMPLADQSQIVQAGRKVQTEEMLEDGISVSKIITPVDPDKENYFDVTLTINTKTKISEIEVDQDIAIVLVVDTSTSMRYCMTSTNNCNSPDRRIDKAKAAINSFVDEWYEQKEEAGDGVTRLLGLVEFNSNASDKINFTSDRYDSSKSAFTRAVNGLSPTGYTNLEDGLLKAQTMLNNAKNSDNKSIKNKYIILLTDGYPTKLNNSSDSSTTYLDKAAKAASVVAKDNRDKYNIKTYTIGVGVKSQPNFTNYTGNPYAIGYTVTGQTCSGSLRNGKCYKSRNSNTEIPFSDIYTSTREDFKKWLGGSVNQNGTYSNDGGIGYIGKDEYGNNLDAYSDVDEDFGDIYEQIFAKITREVDILNKAWTVTDPMNNNITTLPKYISFEGFYDYNGNLVNNGEINTTLSDSNIASFVTTCDPKDTTCVEDSINWEVRNSEPIDFIPDEEGSETGTFVYELKYRIRLNNELEGFHESNDVNNSYPTNYDATLEYAIVDEEGNINELKYAKFPVPVVKGYLGELEFTKEDEAGNPVSGAVFRLTHNSDCDCKEYENGISELNPADDFYLETISGENGKVSFTNIPSGHKYILSEVSTTDNYILDENTTYDVSVRYNETTSNIKDGTFINYLKDGYLIVTKEVLDDFIDENKEFTFILSTNSVRTSFSYELTTSNSCDRGILTASIDENNVNTVSFTLKHGESIKISIPVTTEYEVVEVESEKYNVTYDDNKKGNILNGTDITTLIQNKTKPISINALKIWKLVEGYKNLPTVKLVLYRRHTSNDEWVKIDDSLVELDENDEWKHTWDNLNGEYEYRVDEISIPEYFNKSINFNEKTNTWEVTNTNTLTVELPQTGSSIGLIMVLMGGSMLLAPFVYKFKYCIKKRVHS